MPEGNSFSPNEGQLATGKPEPLEGKSMIRPEPATAEEIKNAKEEFPKEGIELGHASSESWAVPVPTADAKGEVGKSSHDFPENQDSILGDLVGKTIGGEGQAELAQEIIGQANGTFLDQARDVVTRYARDIQNSPDPRAQAKGKLVGEFFEKVCETRPLTAGTLPQDLQYLAQAQAMGLYKYLDQKGKVALETDALRLTHDLAGKSLDFREDVGLPGTQRIIKAGAKTEGALFIRNQATGAVSADSRKVNWDVAPVKDAVARINETTVVPDAVLIQPEAVALESLGRQWGNRLPYDRAWKKSDLPVDQREPAFIYNSETRLYEANPKVVEVEWKSVTQTLNELNRVYPDLLAQEQVAALQECKAWTRDETLEWLNKVQGKGDLTAQLRNGMTLSVPLRAEYNFAVEHISQKDLPIIVRFPAGVADLMEEVQETVDRVVDLGVNNGQPKIRVICVAEAGINRETLVALAEASLEQMSFEQVLNDAESKAKK